MTLARAIDGGLAAVTGVLAVVAASEPGRPGWCVALLGLIAGTAGLALVVHAAEMVVELEDQT